MQDVVRLLDLTCAATLHACAAFSTRSTALVYRMNALP
jgi:hypothetical protein